jgi:hypothetical protein
VQRRDTGCATEGSGLIPGTTSGSHPVSCPVGIRGLSSGLKQPKRVTDHSPLPSAEVKNVWMCGVASQLPPYVLMVCSLIKNKDECAFTCYKVRSASIKGSWKETIWKI